MLGEGAPRYTGRMSVSSYKPRRAWESPLYHAVAENLATFLAGRQLRGRPVPFFVVRDFRSFLDCGIPAHGFLRVRCEVGGRDRVVPFSCKGRGFCPSCCGRRMAETAARLVDETLPEAPVRQWVLTVPHALRFLMAYDRGWIAAVHHVFVNAVFASLRRRTGLSSLGRNAKGGAVTFVQRFGDALNLNVHFHALALDGVYSETEDGTLLFHPAGPPSDDEVARVVERVARRVKGLLARRAEAGAFDAEPDADDLLPALYGAAVAGRALSGPRAGLKAVRLCGVDGHVSGEAEPDTPRCCAEADGFGLHAGTALPAYDREGVEHLLRYMCRPPVALDRLERLPDGRLLYHLKKRWRDGTDSVVFEPLEFLERLAALVPAPRFNMIRYSGVLAPAASWRDRLAPCVESREDETETAAECPEPPQDATCPPDRHANADIGPASPAPVSVGPQTSVVSCPARKASAPAGGAGCPQPALSKKQRPKRYAWAELLKRVFAVDALECDRCGGRMRILCAVNPPEAIRKILACLGMPIRAPPIAPALIEWGDAADDIPVYSDAYA